MNLVNGSDYRIVYQNLPEGIKGFVTEDASGFYTIVINLRHSAEVQEQTVRHELAHITRNDFQKFCVSDIENEFC